MALARSRIEAQGNLVELGLTVDGQVGALGQVLAQQAVGVLVAAALPRTMRVSEVHLHASAQGQRIVITHLLAQVVCERFAQDFLDGLERFAETLQRIRQRWRYSSWPAPRIHWCVQPASPRMNDCRHP